MRAWMSIALLAVVGASCGYPQPARVSDGDGGMPDATAVDGAGDGPGDTSCTDDLSSSPENCGACGHSCGGGTCDLGVCQPTAIPNVPAATSISVDGPTLYFTAGTRVLACPKSGCVLQPTQLDDMSMNGYSTWAVHVTNGTLFFMSAPTQSGSEHDDLVSCPLTGCPSPAPILAAARFGIAYLDNVGNDVYYADADVRHTFRSTCAPNYGPCDPVVILLDVETQIRHFAARGDEIYFVDTGGLEKCPYAGCVAPATPTRLTSQIPTGIVYFGGLVYMQFGDTMHTLNGAIRTCDPVDCNAGTPKELLAHRDPIDGLTVDNDGVYWVEDNTIYSCPRTGCVGGPKKLATGVTRMINPGIDTHVLVTDDAFVYWINSGTSTVTPGTVMRVAKSL
jgi:hypothetical protein